MIQINKELDKKALIMVSKMTDEEVIKFLEIHWNTRDVTKEEQVEHLNTYNHRYMAHKIMSINLSMLVE